MGVDTTEFIVPGLVGNGESVLNHLYGDATPASRRRFSREMGVGHKGRRDIYEAAGYKRAGELDGKTGYEYFRGLYEREPLAGRIIDMPPKTTWRHPPEIAEPEQEEGTEFTEAVEALEKRLRMYHHCERVDRLARIGRFGVLLIGVAGSSDEELREEMPPGRTADDVLYLSAFSEGMATVTKVEDDPTEPRYGLPVTYTMQFGGDSGTTEKEMEVHHSRVIHVAEDLLDDSVYARPVLKRVANLIYDLQKYNAAGAESFWQLADRILLAQVSDKQTLPPAVKEAMKEAGEEALHDLRRLFITNADWKWLEGNPTSPLEGIKAVAMQLAAGAEIPMRLLIGNETGERASTEDQRQYLGSIAERQEQHAEPVILRPLLDRLVEYRYLPRPGRDGYDVVWPNLYQLDEKAQSEIDLNRARALKELAPVGGDPRELAEIDEEGRIWLRPMEAGGPGEEEPPVDEGPPEAGDTMEEVGD